MTDFIVPSRVFKKDFVSKVRNGLNVYLLTDDNVPVTLRNLTTQHPNGGKTFTVTNRRRSWFATLMIGPNNKVTVK